MTTSYSPNRRKFSSKSVARDVSLARVLSKLGVASRSQAARMITQGRVSVNGRVVRQPSFRCAVGSDIITIDGARIEGKRPLTIMMNKPAGVVTTRSDERGRKTVYDFLGGERGWLFPVGRLDKETSGLLLFTNDNRLGEMLTNPRSKVPKTYRVRLAAPLAPDHARIFRGGMILDGERLRPAVVQMITPLEIEITIVEGKNRQIRRMLAAFGYEIISLSRIQIGGYRLGRLQEGRWTVLGKKEIELLLEGDDPASIIQ